MAISLKTQKMLWGRSAGRCAFPECRRPLVENTSETDDPTLVGENCHIIAERQDGPRGDSLLTTDDRNRYDNLILLCSIHHKIIDDNENQWPIDKLKAIKYDHEKWVEDSLGIDFTKLRDDITYSAYIDHWSQSSHIESWLGWSSYILCGDQPRIRATIYNDLFNLRRWLLTRIWPQRYTSLESAFENFRRVLNDFQSILTVHLETPPQNDRFFTKKFYQIREWNPQLYEKLGVRYEFHVDLVSDLMLELTRAANLVCDEIRTNILHSYRINEGNLVVQRDSNFGFIERVVRYKREELNILYPGLSKFYTVRSKRDWCIGDGHPPE